MTLLFVPAWMLPDRHHRGLAGRDLAGDDVCSRTTIMAASTTGSTAACGIEPCAPRPWTVIRMLSAADSVRPGLGPDPAGGERQHVLGQRHVDVPDDVGQPVLDHPAAPSPVSSAG